jgi:hypothetical protein
LKNAGGSAAELTARRGNFGSSVASNSGDFNGDGVINSADYVLWRNGAGTTRTPAEYDVWRSHFGRAAGAGADEIAGDVSTAVPEPSSVVLLTAAAIAGFRSSSKRRVR